LIRTSIENVIKNKVLALYATSTKPLVPAGVYLEIKKKGGGWLDEKVYGCQSLLNVNKQYYIIICLPQRLYSCRSTIIFIYQLFRCFLDVGIFPSVWKISSMITVFKSGDPSNFVNYSPI